MNATERKRKFNEFLRISQEGILVPSAIARKLGVSINTLYNWRKRLPVDISPVNKPVEQSLPAPSYFSRVALESKRKPSAPSFIEIAIGNTIVLRVPPQQVSSDLLHTILEHSTFWG